MLKYQVVLREVVLHTVFVDAESPLSSDAPILALANAINGFNDGDLYDTDAERLELEVSSWRCVSECEEKIAVGLQARMSDKNFNKGKKGGKDK